MGDATGATAEAGAKPAKPARMSWVSPYLLVGDVEAAVRFCESAFGFARVNVNAGPDGVASHAEMTWMGETIMMGLQGAYGGTTMGPKTSGASCPASLYVYCDDVDALAERAKLAGAEVRFGPADAFYGDRICCLVDPDGYQWTFATGSDPG